MSDIKPPIELVIKELDSKINWGKIHKTMLLLNWQYTSCKSVPSIKELKKTVNRLIERIYIGDCYSCSTGGFTVEFVKGSHSDKYKQVSVSFTLEERMTEIE